MKKKIAALVCGVLLVAGGGLYATGTVDEWQAKRSLDDACDGIVSLASARTLLGERGVRARQLPLEGDVPSETLTNCRVRSADRFPGFRLRVSKGERNLWILREIRHYLLQASSASSAPIGEGWPGVVTEGGDLLTHVTLALSCGDGRAEYLWVQGEGYAVMSPGFREEDRRLALSRIVTAAAKEAGRKWGCDVPAGTPPAEWVPSANYADPVGLAAASGTCSGAGAVAEVAAQAGLRRVLEAPTSPDTPVEDCFLLNESGEKVLRFSSFFGAFTDTYRVGGLQRSQPEGSDDGLRWKSSECRSGHEGLHVLATLEAESGEAGPELQEALLTALAADAAERKNCTVTSAP
ncbi:MULTISPECIES: hypothetical protein [Streptomyces]|uniref:hypothetical protein n=1 Tax=Streptomyces TaxID=1883 RepID=UPI002248F2BE|nr:hypothetical protein [Streptomyces sp. JHD 1]MCX2967372.1 hypothetical protein [Streptomyces sp. JHD 1]